MYKTKQSLYAQDKLHAVELRWNKVVMCFDVPDSESLLYLFVWWW
jgi:hypothetical protein